jgi:predicted Zn-dependent protease
MSRTVSLAPLLLTLAACSGGGDPFDGVNIFTIQDDKQLGRDTRDQILADPETYPLLDEAEYPEAYAYLDDLRDEILVSDEFNYADEFPWELHIINDDTILNAFCAPGGYIYVYTGLIRYLDEADWLAGVMGHEMAHADQRHMTQQLTEIYGIETLLSVVSGKNTALIGQIAETAIGLQFSRDDEAEADEYSVRYLCDTDYAADGAAGFFEKIIEEGDDYEIPEFLSDHPSSPSRVEDINALAETLGCSTEINPNGNYDALIDALPPPQATGS